jgi:hypothetical protein
VVVVVVVVVPVLLVVVVGGGGGGGFRSRGGGCGFAYVVSLLYALASTISYLLAVFDPFARHWRPPVGGYRCRVAFLRLS